MMYIAIKGMMTVRAVAWGRRITLNALDKATGMSRMTLSRMLHNKGYSAMTSHLDKWCQFFECE